MVWIYNSKVRKLYSQQHILDDQLAFYSILSKLKKKKKEKRKKKKKKSFIAMSTYQFLCSLVTLLFHLLITTHHIGSL